MGSEPDRPSRLGAILDLLPADAQAIVRGLEDEAKTLRITAEALEAQVRALGQLPVRWAANKRFEILNFKSLNSNFRELELANLLGLVLGCIAAKLWKYILVGKLSPRSTQCTPLHSSKITFL